MDTIKQAEQDRQELSQRRENRRLTLEEDFKQVLSTKGGRRLLAELFELTGVFRCSYTGDTDTYFREGMRNIGLVYLARLNDLCPEHYHTLLTELNDDV